MQPKIINFVFNQNKKSFYSVYEVKISASCFNLYKINKTNVYIKNQKHENLFRLGFVLIKFFLNEMSLKFSIQLCLVFQAY